MVFVWYNVLVNFSPPLRPQLTRDAGVDIPIRIQRFWGQYSPYYPAGEYVPAPTGCNVTQVNILHRHGARYPSHSDAPGYMAAVAKLLEANKYKVPELEFLKDYEYVLDEDHLLPLGAEQSWESGIEAYERYTRLVRSASDIFVRASDQERVVDTAGNWTQGFADSSHGKVKPVVDLLLSEKVNDTLDNNCPNASEAEEEMATWLHQFAPPIAKRLRKAAPGANVSEDDTFGLMAMCPFESIANANAEPHLKKNAHSKFCNLFAEDEWPAFEYHGDIEKYYKTGPGNSLGPVQGIGYVNELLARLTDSPVQDRTQHNASLPFPLHKRLYADFTHENLMVAVYAAIGLFNVEEGEAPNPRKIPKHWEHRVWRASRMVPFSARMVVERLECGRVRAEDEEEEGWVILAGDAGAEETETETFVRIFVNDALQPLEFCGAKTRGGCAG
ncbi:histidine phosphatase superfamily [Fomitopsis serialis]|uniref:histidine phosphatase superfamily n=1 Tax=Fomitopsis serialis TaxID=139415 RepID=UPI00200775E9|nr:histidine phosphatase superfamily [Neoantrodia serialis]KAH9931261.1 histidine phosphatase superfamily [Neoantrodia serialis]